MRPSSATAAVDGSARTIRANGLPNHDAGDFPNPANPSSPVVGLSSSFYYIATIEWPFVGRCFVGTIADSFHLVMPDAQVCRFASHSLHAGQLA